MVPKNISWGYCCLLSRHCTPFNGGRAAAAAAAAGGSIRRRFSSSPQPSTPPQEQATTSSASLLGKKPIFPWLMVPPAAIEGHQLKSEEETDKNFYNFFTPAEGGKVIKVKKVPDFPHENARCVGSSHGWLAFSHPQPNNSVSLVNPFLAESQRYHFPLPPLEADIKKLILSSDPHDSGCIAAAIVGPERKLAYCKPAAGDKKWTFLEGFNDNGGGNGEIYYSSENQCLYATDDKVYYGVCGIEAWDLANDHMRSTATVLPIVHTWNRGEGEPDGLFGARKMLRSTYCDEKRYLVESSGEILMVSRFVARQVGERSHGFIPSLIEDDEEDEEEKEEEVGIYKTFQVEAYRWDRAQNRLETVDSLDDRALFVGLNHSFSLSALEFTEIGVDKKDAVYFTDDNFEKMEALSDVGGHDLGYSRIIGSNGYGFTYLFNGCDCSSDIFPLSSNRIYPPPVWVHP